MGLAEWDMSRLGLELRLLLLLHVTWPLLFIGAYIAFINMLKECWEISTFAKHNFSQL